LTERRHDVTDGTQSTPSHVTLYTQRREREKGETETETQTTVLAGNLDSTPVALSTVSIHCSPRLYSAISYQL